MTLDRDSFVPLHAQLTNILERQILAGTWAQGAAIPSESVLCSEYTVSRITVRRALNDLEAEGLVRRERGRGTFVAQASSRRSHAIGLVFGGLSESTFGHRNAAAFGDMIQGAAEAANRHAALVHPILVQNQDLHAALATPVITRFTGLLVHLHRRMSPDVLDVLDGLNLPYVVVKRRLQAGRGNCVYLDDRAGSEAATEHLISLGHRRIGLIMGPPAVGVWEDRQAGYEAAHAAAGLPVDADLIHHVNFPMDEAGRQTAQDLMQSANPPSAIFAGNDYIAWGVYQAARSLNREPGRDLAVVGYGANTFAATMHPGLSTVGTSGRTLGSASADLLFDLIDGKRQGPAHEELPWQLIVRESSDWKADTDQPGTTEPAASGRKPRRRSR